MIRLSVTLVLAFFASQVNAAAKIYQLTETYNKYQIAFQDEEPIEVKVEYTFLKDCNETGFEARIREIDPINFILQPQTTSTRMMCYGAPKEEVLETTITLSPATGQGPVLYLLAPTSVKLSIKQ